MADAKLATLMIAYPHLLYLTSTNNGVRLRQVHTVMSSVVITVYYFVPFNHTTLLPRCISPCNSNILSHVRCPSFYRFCLIYFVIYHFN